jgi:exosortase
MPSPNRQVLVAGLTVAALLVTLYGVIPYTYSHLLENVRLISVAQALWLMWNAFPDFQHGMLVPVLAAVVIYLQREKLAAIPITGWWPAIVLVALSLLMFWAGRRVDNQYIGFFSLQALLGSLVLWLLGWRWLWALAFPLAFLVFTWPMPFLDNIITFPLRMLMSSMSVAALNFFGLAVIQNGTGIFSAPNAEIGLAAGKLFQVDVADPCSGIRSLFALMMISALFGYFTLQSPWKRGVLFLCSIPLAIAGNLARILLLTLGIITLGSPTAIGTLEDPSWFHEGAGYVVFLVALGGMLAVAKLLNSTSSQWRENWKRLQSEVKNSTAIEPSSSNAKPDIY